jgi:hypothetical protein
MSLKVTPEKFRKSVVKLYSTILREGRKWPHNPSRRRRSLVTAIPFIVRNKFREAQTEADTEKGRLLAKTGAEELLALKRLMSNQHMNAVRSFAYTLTQSCPRIRVSNWSVCAVSIDKDVFAKGSREGWRDSG